MIPKQIKLVKDFFNKVCKEIDGKYYPNVKMWQNPDGTYNQDVRDIHRTVELMSNGCLSYDRLITRLAKSCKELEANIKAITDKYVTWEPQTLKGGNPIPETLEYHRKPTEYELKRGYGATHYRDFKPEDFLKPDMTIKKRIKAKNDGLTYTR